MSSYDEHLISMAGGDGDELDAIQRRADMAPRDRARRSSGRNTMQALGIALMALPIALFMLAGLIFDTADFLGGMGILAMIFAPMAAGFFLLTKAEQ